MTRPHESPECRCERCASFDEHTAASRALMSEACRKTMALLDAFLRVPNVTVGPVTMHGEGYEQTVSAEVTVDWEPPAAQPSWPPPLYAVDDETVSLDSDGGRRALVGYLADMPPLPFPAPPDAMAVRTLVAGTFIFRGERSEPCARGRDPEACARVHERRRLAGEE